MITQVAALYVDPRGPYHSMPGVDCWDVEKDARLYDGSHPIVAHPPCGPWSKLRHIYKGDEYDCAPRALEQVRAFGGVLEHPAHSALWAYFDLPKPGDATDGFGGRTWYVEQVDWGHCCVKPTWLYIVGADQRSVSGRIARRNGTGTATHCICTGPRQKQRLPAASRRKKLLTPPPFAELLVSIARTSREKGGAK